MSRTKEQPLVANNARPRTRNDQMATLKRLNDDDVRAVFECLHSSSHSSLLLQLPEHLQFRIVPVGPGGHKLSPPSYEFQDGLYVLLKPPRKRKKNAKLQQHPLEGNDPSPEDLVPKHLAHLIMKEGEFPAEACKWSLSGPQYVNYVGWRRHASIAFAAVNYSRIRCLVPCFPVLVYNTSWVGTQVPPPSSSGTATPTWDGTSTRAGPAGRSGRCATTGARTTPSSDCCTCTCPRSGPPTRAWSCRRARRTLPPTSGTSTSSSDSRRHQVRQWPRRRGTIANPIQVLGSLFTILTIHRQSTLWSPPQRPRHCLCTMGPP